MKIKDRVYGEEEIKERVLIDIINSNELQRLKEISQFGLPEEYSSRKPYSRHEHSLGVLILLKRLKAELKEQIAGLIHDISHTAFSHVVDWVIGDASKEDYQDKIFSTFIKNSEIPKILEKHNFNYEDFLELEKFTLLEQPIPNLCADRFDYAIREIVEFEDVDFLLKHLLSKNGKIVFDSLEAAEIFGRGYLKCQKQHWASDDARGRYSILADILKEALKKNIISLQDLHKTDNFVLNILENSGNQKIKFGLALLKEGFRLEKTNNEQGIILIKKNRFVNPLILIDKNLKLLSDVSDSFKEYLNSNIINENNFQKVLIKRLK